MAQISTYTEQILHVLYRDDDDGDLQGWAQYIWSDKQQIYRYKTGNEFSPNHPKHPRELTPQQVMLINLGADLRVPAE